MIDVAHEVNDVRREVGSRTLEAGEARTVRITRVFDTDVEDLWDACTNAERIPRWFLPVAGDLRAGGHYQLEGNASGTIERCDPPRSFFATWEIRGETSWIELRLAADPAGGTRFELEHIAHVDDETWAQFGPGAVGIGWDLGLMGLALHVASGGEPVDAAAVAAWQTSDDGIRFMTLSNERWAEARIAAGAEAAEAQAAAARTLAAYTGAPAP
jgi:uncharacterized protein YndB with AHSA1/START domain